MEENRDRKPASKMDPSLCSKPSYGQDGIGFSVLAAATKGLRAGSTGGDGRTQVRNGGHKRVGQWTKVASIPNSRPKRPSAVAG